MKKYIGRMRHRLHEYWQRVMESHINCMNRGAQQLARIITWAHKDNWRRKERKK